MCAKTTIDEIILADDPERWEALGFDVADAAVQVGDVRIVPAGGEAGRGILGWSLRGVASTALDGLPTTMSHTPPQTPPSQTPPHTQPPQTPPPDRPQRLAPPPHAPLIERNAAHPNGIAAIDHVVAMSPDLDRSVRALQAAGLDLRRLREQPTPAGAPRQAFFRLGEVILEVVQEPEEVVAARSDGAEGGARFWGLALLSDNLDQTVMQLGEHAGEIRAAVQPGRRIATLRRSAGLTIPLALMSRADT